MPCAEISKFMIAEELPYWSMPPPCWTLPDTEYAASTSSMSTRALAARGFFEEVLAADSVSGNVQQGGGIDQYGSSSAIMNFEISAQGMGAKYVLDGTDYCAAMFNPEGDMGDVEMWELISPFVYLSRLSL